MTINIGDRVRYRAEFCRSIGVYTGELPHARGEVLELRPMAAGKVVIAVIDWHNPDVPPKVNVKNLERLPSRGV